MPGTVQDVNFSDSTPSAPSGKTNATWQTDGNGNISVNVPNLTASGAGHQAGLAPDPGGSAGTTHFLREDASWAVPSSSQIQGINIDSTSPLDGQLLVYRAGSLTEWRCSFDNGMRFQHNPLPGATFGGGSAYGITTWTAASGGGGTGSIGNSTNPGATPASNTLTTSATASSSVGFTESGSTGSGSLSLTTLRSITFAISLGQTTNMRMWLGLANLGGSGTGTQLTGWRTDTPGTSFAIAAFRFSPTTAGDTKWECVTSDGTTQNVVSSGVTPDTSIHRFQIVFDGTNVVFLIDDVTVCTTSTHIPSTSTNLFPQGWLDNAATANAVNFKYYGTRGVFGAI